MSAFPSLAYSRPADLIAARLRAVAFDAFELLALAVFLAAIACGAT